MSDNTKTLTLEEIIPTIEQVKNTIVTLKTELEEKQRLVEEKEKEIVEREIKFNEVNLAQQQLENEYASLETEFRKVSEPHAKILYILHGDKSEMSREELNKATGFSAAIVLHSLHELNRAELISYDDETAKASLVNRIF
jgi:uncharacterized protein (DUF3084 family)